VCVLGGGRWHGWHSPASLEGAVVALVADARQHRRVDERVAGIAHALSIVSRPNARDCNPRELPADDQVRICAPEARRREGRQHTAAQTRMGTSPFPLSPLPSPPREPSTQAQYTGPCGCGGGKEWPRTVLGGHAGRLGGGRLRPVLAPAGRCWVLGGSLLGHSAAAAAAAGA
jgi:hypothetical protein